MTDTLIALISILVGVAGAYTTGFIFKKHSFGIIGNTIAGVFGSIFLIKTFGRLGFDPITIMKSGTVNSTLFAINVLASFMGGAMGLIAIKWIKNKLNK